MISVHDASAAAALGDLSRFRHEFHQSLTTRADALFELTDALLCVDGPITSLVELSLAAEQQPPCCCVSGREDQQTGHREPPNTLNNKLRHGSAVVCALPSSERSVSASVTSRDRPSGGRAEQDRHVSSERNDRPSHCKCQRCVGVDVE
jgi:hypothetical protein